MSGNNIIVDTNILSFLFEKEQQIFKILSNKTIHISFITKIELLSNRNLTKEDRCLVKEILKVCKIHTIDDEIIENSIQIRTNYKLKIPDSIIAATAKSLDYPLLTDDVEFQKLDKIIGINIYSRT